MLRFSENSKKISWPIFFFRHFFHSIKNVWLVSYFFHFWLYTYSHFHAVAENRKKIFREKRHFEVNFMANIWGSVHFFSRTRILRVISNFFHLQVFMQSNFHALAENWMKIFQCNWPHFKGNFMANIFGSVHFFSRTRILRVISHFFHFWVYIYSNFHALAENRKKIF